VTSTRNTQHSQETNIHAPVGFEPKIPASELPQTHSLDRAASGIGHRDIWYSEFLILYSFVALHFWLQYPLILIGDFGWNLSYPYCIIQGDQNISVHLMITIQKVTSNVQSVPRQSPDIYWHAELCSRIPCSVERGPHSECILWGPSFCMFFVL
jgi:hypothetical protein